MPTHSGPSDKTRQIEGRGEEGARPTPPLSTDLAAEAEEHWKNPNAAGQAVWVGARGWSRLA
jgi:hypothetical protein